MTFLKVCMYFLVSCLLASSSAREENASHQLEDLMREIKELKNLNVNMREQNLKFEEQNEKLKIQNEKLEHHLGKQQTPSGFSAAIDAIDPPTFVCNAGETLVFGNDVTNVGENYDPNTGIYTCPMTGVYLFSSALFSDYWGSLAIVVDGVPQVVVRPDAAGANDQASNTAIVECIANQSVWVRCEEAVSIFRGVSQYANTFTGALLYES